VGINLNFGGSGLPGLGGIGLPVRQARSGGCGSIFGVFFGLFLVPAAFYMVYYGEKRLVNHGVVFERIALSTPEAAAGQQGGLVKVQGKPAGEFVEAPRHPGAQVLYWRTDVEEYKEERDSDGDIDRDWETVSGEKRWVPFTLGPIKVSPQKANPVGEETVYKGYKPRGASDFDPNGSDGSPQVGDQRLTVEVLPADREYLVLGEAAGGSIASGSSFVVSALDEAGTVAALKLEYKIFYWVLKGGAVLAMWMGIMSIFGPLTMLVGWIPFIGERINSLVAFGAFIISTVTVGLLTVLFKLFWVIALVGALVLIFLIVRGVTTPRQRPGTAPAM